MRKRLLLVDDSVFIWQEMKYMLSNSDYEIVGCAKTGEEALELYEQVSPDIVTMDIILPGLDGIQTAKRIFQRWPNAKIVMVSSLAYDTTIEDARSIGACQFVFKPFEKDLLLNALNAALGVEVVPVL